MSTVSTMSTMSTMSTKPRAKYVKKMKKKRDGKGNEKVSSGRVLLKEIEQEQEKTLSVGDLEWHISYSRSTIHIYNNIKIATHSLRENEYCRVKMQIYSPNLFPGCKSFWHQFDCERNTFCVPFAEEIPEEDQDDPLEKFQKLIYSDKESCVRSKSPTPTREPFIRLMVSKTWSQTHLEDRNHQFPFADTILRTDTGHDLYVNRRILYCSSRYFNRTIFKGHPKIYKNWAVLHLKYINFEDLHDLIGFIYHDWTFEIHHSLHLQSIAEMFGVMYHSVNTCDFEGRTSLDALSSRCYNMCQRTETVRYYDRVEVLRLKLKIKLEELALSKSKSKEKLYIKEEDYEDSEEQEEQDQDDQEEEEEMQIDPVYASWTGGDILNIKDDDGNTVESFRTKRFYLDYQPKLSELSSDDPHVKLAIELLDEGDQFFQIVESETLNKQRARYGFYTFDFDPLFPRDCRGVRVTVNGGFVKWDMYLYRTILNGTDYLSLGIYMLGMQPNWFYETRMSIKVCGKNANGGHKIFSHSFHNELNNFGYPDFMRWCEVVKCGGTVNVVVHAQVKFMKKHLEHYLMPGTKDTQLEVEGKVILVNRDVLSSASPVFKALFRPSFLPNRSKIHVIKGVYFEEFMELLYCLYHRESTHHYLFGAAILQLAVKFKIDWVKDQMLRGFATHEFQSWLLEYLDSAKDRVKYQMLIENWKGFHRTNRKKPLTLKQL